MTQVEAPSIRRRCAGAGAQAGPCDWESVADREKPIADDVRPGDDQGPEEVARELAEVQGAIGSGTDVSRRSRGNV